MRRSKTPQTYLANKCDGVELDALSSEFYALGVSDVVPISALQRRGVRELVEQLLAALPNSSALKQSEKDRQAKIRDAERLADEAEQQDAEQALLAESEAETAAAEAYSEEGVSEQQTHTPRVAPQFAPVFSDAPELEADPSRLSPAADDYIRANKTLSIDESSPNYFSDGSLHGPGDEADGQDAASGFAAQQERFLSAAAPECIRLAIIGRPNVGKSTLVNTLTGERRAITSDIAGTTRDSLDLELTREGQDYRLVDTAGLRKKARVELGIERFSTLRSLRAIEECDVAIVLLDATEGPIEQDAKIIGLAHDAGKGIVLVVNKWDAIEKDHKSVKKFKDDVQRAFKFTPYAPVLFVSALSGKRCPNILETAREVATARLRKIPTSALNQLLEKAMRRRTAPVVRGRPVKLYYSTQIDVAPPRIALMFNYPESVHFSYLRFLKNSIREQFPFPGSDLKMSCRKRSRNKR